MKISWFKTLILIKDIRRLVSQYAHFRTPYSDKGYNLSDAEKRQLGEAAFKTLESIINLLIK